MVKLHTSFFLSPYLALILCLAPACSSPSVAQTPLPKLIPSCSINSKNCEDSVPVVTDFDSCVSAGNKVLKTMPARCLDKTGKVYMSTSHANRIIDATPLKKFCKDLCGDGTCQEMVCMAVGCPCAENSASCPTDCK